MHVTAGPVRPRHRLRPELPAVEVDRCRPHVPAGSDGARRRSRAVDRPAQSAANDRRQRRRRLRLVQRRPVLVLDLQPADGTALPRHHRQPLSVSRVRLAAGQHRDQHPQLLADRRDHRARLDQARRRRKSATSPSSTTTPTTSWPRARSAGASPTTSCTCTTTRRSRTGRTRSGPSSTAGAWAPRRSSIASTGRSRSTTAATIRTCSGSPRSTSTARPTTARAGRC